MIYKLKPRFQGYDVILYSPFTLEIFFNNTKPTIDTYLVSDCTQSRKVHWTKVLLLSACFPGNSLQQTLCAQFSWASPRKTWSWSIVALGLQRPSTLTTCLLGSHWRAALSAEITEISLCTIRNLRTSSAPSHFL